MKSKSRLVVVALTSLMVGFGLGYRCACKRTRNQAVVFAVDRQDTTLPGTGKPEFDPVFTRGNPISKSR